MKMLVSFLAICVRNAVKTMVVDRNNQKALALPYLASKPRVVQYTRTVTDRETMVSVRGGFVRTVNGP